MGNKFTLSIHLEHGNDGDCPIVAGNSLKGKVLVTAKRRFAPGKLQLHLLGTESTSIVRARKTVRDERVIARAMTTLRDFGPRNKLAKGRHETPFEFVLPSSLPSTTQFPKLDTRAYNGRIQYLLRVDLGEYRLERPFVLASAPLPADVVPCLTQPKTHELKSFGLMKKGYLSVGASVENTRVGKGRVLQVSVASRNDASVDVERVRVKLVGLIEYHAREEKEVSKLELGKLKDVNLPGLHKSKARGADVRRNIREGFVQNIEHTYTAIYEALVSGLNRFEVFVPPTARDTYNGNLITISHYLKITFITKALVENPSTKVPIVVGNPRVDEDPTDVSIRLPEEPMATMIFEDDIPDTESTIEVGSRAEAIPMASAIMLGQPENSLLDNHGPATPASALSPDDVMVLSSDSGYVFDEESHGTNYYDSQEAIPPPEGPIPSAPDEGLLMRSPRRSVEEDHGYLPSGLNQSSRHPLSTPPRNRNEPIGGERNRGRVDSYSFTYSDYTEDSPNRQDLQQRLGFAPPPSQAPEHHPVRSSDSHRLFEHLLAELRGSIHDYEVVVRKTREPAYMSVFQTLTPQEFGRIVASVSMSHQVQVAWLLARQMSSNRSAFTCEHCVAALHHTSDYFRPNMVETLLPYCGDLSRNRKVIQSELSEWEQIATSRAFDLALRRAR